MIDAPPGFAPLFRSSPFLDLLGPFYQREEGDGLVVGLRIVRASAIFAVAPLDAPGG